MWGLTPHTTLLARRQESLLQQLQHSASAFDVDPAYGSGASKRDVTILERNQQVTDGRYFGSGGCMSRPLRPLIPGGTYHVMNRGNRKSPIFHDDRDRKRFTRLLIEAADVYGVTVDAGSQMGTHFHAIVETPHANLSVFMQQLEGEYADYFNWRYGLVGHLFQGPFKSVVIEDDIHLLTAAWYVFANPCHAGYCQHFQDWPWSTYAATAAFKPVPDYLSLTWVETLFPAESLEESRLLLRKCMEEADPIAAYLLAVDPTSDSAIRSHISERLRALRQPCALREIVRPSLGELFPPGLRKPHRDRAIRTAKVVHGYTLAEIAKMTGLHPASVSRIFCSTREASESSISDSD